MKYNPYSFSKLSTFKGCNRKFKYQYIDKIKFPIINKALEKGSYIHLLIESFIKKEKPNFNFKLSTKEDIQEYNKIFKQFIKSNLTLFKFKPIGVEVDFGLKIENKRLVLSPYEDSETILRGKIDFLAIFNDKFYIIDWKSGKVPQSPDEDQLKLYALWAFKKWEKLKNLECSFVYVEHNINKTYKFNRGDIRQMELLFLSQIHKIEKEKEFNKNVTNLCDWCVYFQNKICDTSSSINEFNNFKPKRSLI